MMTYSVSDAEKDQAMKALRWFDYCLKLAETAQDHLNLIYDPFKKNNDIPSAQIFKIRATLREYRDKVIDNFNNFKKVSFKCYMIIQPFMSDTQMEKLIKSFVTCVESIETQVNRFVDLFANLKSEDLTKGVVSAIENIKKEIAQLKQIIEERIKKHIQENILARNWVDNISEELQEKVEKKSPLIMQLMEDRMNLINK